jgi:hypothetical protein
MDLDPTQAFEELEPHEIVALAQLDPTDPDVARYLVRELHQHLTTGADLHAFVKEGIAFGPLVITALGAIVGETNSDDSFIVTMEQITAIAIPPSPPADEEPFPRVDLGERRVEPMPKGDHDMGDLKWVIRDNVGPLASFKTQQEAQDELDKWNETS